MKNKWKKALYLIGYIAPIMYIQINSFIYHISVYASKDFIPAIGEIREVNNISKEEKKKNIKLFIFSVLFCFVLRYLFFIGETDSGFNIFGVNVFPTYTILMYITIAVIWRKRNIAKPIVKRKMKTLIYSTIAILLPVIINNIIIGILEPRYYMSSTDYIQELWSCFFIAAIVEEFYFRGFMYEILKKITSRVNAQIISSFIFTCWHLNIMYNLFYTVNSVVLINIVSIFVLGIITCQLYDRNHSLIPAIAYHAINNGIIYCFISFLLI